MDKTKTKKAKKHLSVSEYYNEVKKESFRLDDHHTITVEGQCATNHPFLIDFLHRFFVCKQQEINQVIAQQFLPYIHHDSKVKNKKHYSDNYCERAIMTKFEVRSFKVRYNKVKKGIIVELKCFTIGELHFVQKYKKTVHVKPTLLFEIKFKEGTSKSNKIIMLPEVRVSVQNLTDKDLIQIQKDSSDTIFAKAASYASTAGMNEYLKYLMIDKMKECQKDFDEDILKVVKTLAKDDKFPFLEKSIFKSLVFDV